MNFAVTAVLAFVAIAHAGEVTKITHGLTGERVLKQGTIYGCYKLPTSSGNSSSFPGHDSFSNVRVFVDGCDQDNPNDVCNLEGYSYPCCHVNKATPVKGYLTMANEKKSVTNGEVKCQGTGLGRPQPCTEPDFCNSLNATCPLVPGDWVKFDFELSTSSWYHVQIGSRLEHIELTNQDDKELLSFDLNFKVL